ncbi:hypothetical protein LTR78_004140 [Recurvomyces mirabilis]|uniref:Enoyl reductase (ER) domain-containing protein n=1 Tax=Recurvomyces mirabilis TaxID=574656 RepID=A0AAE0WQS2_9PEZI|nr:hypothetical protein LTR78_004140 [Recurvomyces mirabilis]KAK5153689.1 hypothetical protein LTS14_007383 [Recurvomyces mirabilis]
MKAAVIHEAGGPDVLKIEEVPIPKPRPGWVLIRIKAFGLNRSELFTRQGHSPGVQFPRILGIEATGLVEEAPGGEFQRGDVVATAMGGMGRSFNGGYAEYTCVAAGQIQKLETKLSWHILGGCGEMLQTAYGSLFNALQLKKGETLLVRGGTTSIGLAAAAIAKSHGVKVISTTRNSARNELLKKSGADIVVIDSGKVAEEVKNQTDGGVNKVLELIGTTTLLDSLQCVKPHGIVCMTGMVGDSWNLKDFSPMDAIPTSICLTSYDGGPDAFISTPLQELVNQIEAGTLPVSIGKTFKLDDIVEAHRTMEQNKAGGKIVVLT